MSRSEIARLRQRIENELEVMRRGLVGISAGNARHLFIHTRMNQIGACQHQLAGQLGEKVAAQIVCQLYTQAMEFEAPSENC